MSEVHHPQYAASVQQPYVQEPVVSAAPLPRHVAESSNRPQFQVIGKSFVWYSAEQGEIRITLSFKMKLLRQLHEFETWSEIQQLFYLLDGVGDEKSKEQIDELDTDEGMQLVEAYFAEFERLQGARRAESSRSSI